MEFHFCSQCFDPLLVIMLQKKLIMIGSCGTLSTIPLLRLLVEKVAETGGLLDLTNKDARSFGKHKSSR
jgi:DNA replication ATP-dependent helicase Dna2